MIGSSVLEQWHVIVTVSFPFLHRIVRTFEIVLAAVFVKIWNLSAKSIIKRLFCNRIMQRSSSSNGFNNFILFDGFIKLNKVSKQMHVFTISVRSLCYPVFGSCC